MKKYQIKLKGERDFTEEELLNFNKNNIYDVVTVIRSQNEGESIILKNTKNFDIYFEEIND
ncbi:hypothetical protein QOK74_08585 [Staphylococcus saprophyticus]|uniref:hypothetical protein n=1 Tax=Staphylococcus saprophyticus TaxID=29385 RepID=UPI0024C3272C|nr:hypothetical protein [Staphylococcus saprophyticus]MDK1672929.1 hypothetical protein [Staphylococcus saprophyticus]